MAELKKNSRPDLDTSAGTAIFQHDRTPHSCVFYSPLPSHGSVTKKLLDYLP